MSLAKPGLMTHLVVTENPHQYSSIGAVVEFKHDHRIDHLEPDCTIQIASIKMELNQTFIPHIHEDFFRNSMYTNTKECWVIIRGLVLSSLFDIDGRKLLDLELSDGDLITTISGGHNYKCLSSDALVFEIKTGPYNEKLDKKRI